MQNKNRRKKPVALKKAPVIPHKVTKRKKKSLAYRPKPFLMVIYWFLALILAFSIFLSLRHYFIKHWQFLIQTVLNSNLDSKLIFHNEDCSSLAGNIHPVCPYSLTFRRLLLTIQINSSNCDYAKSLAKLTDYSMDLSFAWADI